jgi:hypothetical protein
MLSAVIPPERSYSALTVGAWLGVTGPSFRGFRFPTGWDCHHVVLMYSVPFSVWHRMSPNKSVLVTVLLGRLAFPTGFLNLPAFTVRGSPLSRPTAFALALPNPSGSVSRGARLRRTGFPALSSAPLLDCQRSPLRRFPPVSVPLALLP